MNKIVLQTEVLPQQCTDWLADRCDLHVCLPDSLAFKNLLPNASGIVVRTYTKIDQKLLEKAPNLRVIGRAGVGLDNIDIEACVSRNIIVVHTPEANINAVVEFILSTMLPRLRKLPQLKHHLSMDDWNLARNLAISPFEFSEHTVGIIGFGKIGSRLGKILSLLGFRVLFNDLIPIKDCYGCKQVTQSQLLEESDVVSIHVDGRKANEHFFNKKLFSLLKKNVLFINTSRGFVVDSFALTDFLKENLESVAILDVHDPEPVSEDYALLNLQNAVLYPHIAAKTSSAFLNMGWVVKDVVAVLESTQPIYPACL